jgi:hypothetical protein
MRQAGRKGRVALDCAFADLAARLRNRSRRRRLPAVHPPGLCSGDPGGGQSRGRAPGAGALGHCGAGCDRPSPADRRDDLARHFGREVSLIAPGPRSPRPGAPYTFVTTEGFLAAFDLRSLKDLPDPEMMEEAGL